eukprot:TRINITY_DN4412_c0_g1_i10.p1 TRINITY_DN4412_c0_g1~~TRINITY_DN4412_c0_g1_i10.p1  ORF type:complete len:357 (-),score=85.74 TRINITY_DN4412_c0_g1_i10:531-1601(-)
MFCNVLQSVKNSNWWAESARNVKKAAILSPEDNNKIMKHEVCSGLCLRHKFVHVLLYYGISRADDVLKTGCLDWKIFPSGNSREKLNKPYFAFTPNRSKTNQTNDDEFQKIVVCCCIEHTHAVSCPYGVCKSYIDALGDSSRSALLRLVRRQKADGSFAFTKQPVGKDKICPYPFFQEHLQIQPADGDHFTSKTGRTSALDSLVNDTSAKHELVAQQSRHKDVKSMMGYVRSRTRAKAEVVEALHSIIPEKRRTSDSDTGDPRAKKRRPSNSSSSKLDEVSSHFEVAAEPVITAPDQFERVKDVVHELPSFLRTQGNSTRSEPSDSDAALHQQFLRFREFRRYQNLENNLGTPTQF